MRSRPPKQKPLQRSQTKHSRNRLIWTFRTRARATPPLSPFTKFNLPNNQDIQKFRLFQTVVWSSAISLLTQNENQVKLLLLAVSLHLQMDGFTMHLRVPMATRDNSWPQQMARNHHLRMRGLPLLHVHLMYTVISVKSYHIFVILWSYDLKPTKKVISTHYITMLLNSKCNLIWLQCRRLIIILRYDWWMPRKNTSLLEYIKHVAYWFLLIAFFFLLI